MDDRRTRLERARLYLVCDATAGELVPRALRGGVDIVQLRAKQRPDDEIVATGRRYARHCAAHDALLIVNDRPDLVEEIGADGVHVGQDDMPVDAARKLVGADRLIGLSTHTPAQIDASNRADVDYIGVGPVHETPTKPGRPAVGLALVRYAARHAEHRFFAIGGINLGNAHEVAAAGAERIAVVRALTRVREPEAVARALRRSLQAAYTSEARRGAA
ncbi:MAG TPA: thiamine phosphate synthase [Solirubrobacteraceae bacterium]|nr:thiamine phosphate synthase [Solirubrobacteraceae bacterium]